MSLTRPAVPIEIEIREHLKDESESIYTQLYDVVALMGDDSHELIPFIVYNNTVMSIYNAMRDIQRTGTVKHAHFSVTYTNPEKPMGVSSMNDCIACGKRTRRIHDKLFSLMSFSSILIGLPLVSSVIVIVFIGLYPLL